MIVPMKKVSLIIRENKKNETLKKLRKLGIVHIEITEGSGERLASLQEQIALLESAMMDTPVASPSSPSIRLIALMIAIIQSMVIGTANMPNSISMPNGVIRSMTMP